MVKGGNLEDVLLYTSEARGKIEGSFGLSDFYYALKRFDAETYIHSEEVARFAVMIGKKRGFSYDRLINIAISGYMHDIGKIFTGIKIIGKKESLSSEEYDIIKEHPVVGYRHLKYFIDDIEILSGILQHHERMDGSGYGNGLQGSEITEFGKIIAVADVFSALTSTRPYKRAYTCNYAIKFMQDSNGFDSDILNILIDLYLSKKVVKNI